jgi:transcriptional regulator with XRE-family HTH domain
MLDLTKIGNTIETLRKEKNMTQDELASKLFVSRQAVSKWETGKSIPSIEVMILLTELFEIGIEHLIDDTAVLSSDIVKQIEQLPRQAVFSKFIKSDQLEHDFKSYFYLFNTEERKFFINLVIQNKLKLSYQVMWPHLNMEERFYFLGYILAHDENDLNDLYPYLTIEERQMLSRKKLIIYKKGRHI